MFIKNFPQYVKGMADGPRSQRSLKNIITNRMDLR